MLVFWKRHKISSTFLLIVIALIWYVVITVMISNYQKWKIVWPLEDVLVEKYSQDDFNIQHIEVTEERGELQIWEMHVVVSVEMLNSPTFLENCHEVVEMISEYARQHPNQFTLNNEDSFCLSFDCGEYYQHMDSTLEFSNWFYYDTEWERFYDELVNLTIHPVNGLKGISVFDKLFMLDIDCYVSDYDDVVEEVAKMPKLRCIMTGTQGVVVGLTREEKVEYASKLYKYVPFVEIYE